MLTQPTLTPKEISPQIYHILFGGPGFDTLTTFLTLPTLTPKVCRVSKQFRSFVGDLILFVLVIVSQFMLHTPEIIFQNLTQTTLTPSELLPPNKLYPC